MYTHQSGRPFVSVLGNRDNQATRTQWNGSHFEVILAGLRARHKYEDIAVRLADDRPGTNASSVYNLIHSRFNGLDGFLRIHIADPVEIEEIVSDYGTHHRHGGSRPRGTVSGAKETRDPPIRMPEFRPMKDDALSERDRLECIIQEGICNGKSFRTMVEIAAEQGIPAEVRKIERLIRTYGGVTGFLEHMGLSAVESSEMAVRYG